TCTCPYPYDFISIMCAKHIPQSVCVFTSCRACVCSHPAEPGGPHPPSVGLSLSLSLSLSLWPPPPLSLSLFSSPLSLSLSPSLSLPLSLSICPLAPYCGMFSSGG